MFVHFVVEPNQGVVEQDPCLTERGKIVRRLVELIVDTNSDPVYLGAVGPVVDDLLVELTSHPRSTPDILTTEYNSRHKNKDGPDIQQILYLPDSRSPNGTDNPLP